MESIGNQTVSSAEQSLTEQQQFWLKHCQNWQASEKSMAAYARDHGLKVKAFYYWKKRVLRPHAMPSDLQTKSPPVFRKINIQPTSVVETGCRIRFPNGVECELTMLEQPGLENLLVTISGLLPR